MEIIETSKIYIGKTKKEDLYIFRMSLDVYQWKILYNVV